MIKRKIVGETWDDIVVNLEVGRLKFFAQTIGLQDPIYFEKSAAQAKGYPHIVVPPTYFLSMDLERDDPYGWYEKNNISIGSILHASQEFTYHTLAFAGQRIVLRTEIIDNYDKKGGALEFIKRRTVAENEDGVSVATQIMTIAVKHPLRISEKEL